jgi:hypothetical protein
MTKDLKIQIEIFNKEVELENYYVPKVIEILKRYEGKKIFKVDGTPIAKVEMELNNLCLLKKSIVYIKVEFGNYATIFMRTSFQDSTGNTRYAEERFTISRNINIVDGHIGSFTEFTERDKLNFETEVNKALEIQPKIDELIVELDKLHYLTRKIVKYENYNLFGR